MKQYDGAYPRLQTSLLAFSSLWLTFVFPNSCLVMERYRQSATYHHYHHKHHCHYHHDHHHCHYHCHLCLVMGLYRQSATLEELGRPQIGMLAVSERSVITTTNRASAL